MMGVSKAELVVFLDSKLEIGSFRDISNNGLQVDSKQEMVTHIATGVDAVLPFFSAAKAKGADFLLCHHGISWKDSLKRLTGLNFRLVETLISNNQALYGCHLPLDAHPVLGNNAALAKILCIRNAQPFGTYGGIKIGISGLLPSPMSICDVAETMRQKVNPDLKIINFGKNTISSVAIVSGGAADLISEAQVENIDLFITGEADIISYNICLQNGQNMMALGHYASERYGVMAIGELVSKTFGIKHTFIDTGVPF